MSTATTEAALPVAIDANGEVIRLGDPVWYGLMGGVVIGMHKPNQWGTRILVVDWGPAGNLAHQYPVGSVAVRRDPSLFLDIQ